MRGVQVGLWSSRQLMFVSEGGITADGILSKFSFSEFHSIHKFFHGRHSRM